MKKDREIKSVIFNNHKKQLLILYTSGHGINVHYRSLGIKKNIKRAWVDQETRGKSVGIELSDGTIDYMPYDQPLAIIKDPDFLLQSHIELLIAKIKSSLHKRGVSKRYLAQQLNTSDNQIQRLLNPAILNKNLKQLYAIAAILNLDLKVDVQQRKAA